MLIEARWILLGAVTEVASLKKAPSEAENKAAKERTEREKTSGASW